MGRRNATGGGMSLDSLMDTLTNVVGILLIVLIFSLLSGADAVKRIKGFVDDISPEQLAAALAEADELHKLVEEKRRSLQEYEGQTAERQVSLARQKELIAQLKADMAKLASAKINVEELKKDVAQRRAQVESLEKQIGEKEALIASLRARLAETPARGPDADAQIVNLPDPREAPKGSQPLVFLCRGGHVVPVDAQTLQRKAQQVIQEGQRVLFRQNRIDCDKLAQLFEKRFVGDRYCRVKIRVGGDAKPYLAVEPRPEAGDKTETIGKGTSLFNRWIRSVDPNKHYIEFRVFSDSFSTYLEARNAAARKGILAGWVAYPAEAEYWIGIGVDLKTTCLGKEPPPPAPPAKPVDADRPPPPPDVVD